MNALAEPVANTPIQDKWAEALNGGFVVIPSALLRFQHQLKIDSNEMVVLLNLLMSWWKSDDMPYPRTSTLAHRIGVSTRTVQRQLQSLEDKELIKRIWVPSAKPDERASAKYDLSGTVSKLKVLGCEVHPARKLVAAKTDSGTNPERITAGSPIVEVSL